MEELKRQEALLLNVLNQFFIPDLSCVIADFLREDAWRVTRQWDNLHCYSYPSGKFLTRTSPKSFQLWESMPDIRLLREIHYEHEIKSIVLSKSGEHMWVKKWNEENKTIILECTPSRNTSNVLQSYTVDEKTAAETQIAVTEECIVIQTIGLAQITTVWFKKYTARVWRDISVLRGRGVTNYITENDFDVSGYNGKGELNEVMQTVHATDPEEWKGYWTPFYTSFARRNDDRSKFIMLKISFFDVLY